MKKRLGVGVALGIAVASACGSSGSSGTSPNGYACAMADPSAKPAACIQCVASQCSEPLKAAYGANWSSGEVGGGACPSSFPACAKKCACSDAACSSSCLTSAGSNCKNGVLLASSCIAAFCPTVCQ
jgi:hypothetical protein